MATVTLDNETCKMHTEIPNELVDDNTICTVNWTGLCEGAGSPLVIGNFVVGVVSWGFRCGGGFPDVYTRVSSYNGWVEGLTGPNL